MWDEEPSLTLKLAKGTIIVLDLDRFNEVIRERGWSEYSPNPVTGLLSELVEKLAIKWRGVIVSGLDWERGTEEAIIEIPYVHPEEVREDLEDIRETVREYGVTITIVAVYDYVVARRAKTRREAYYGSPGRARALRILRQLKRRGGDMVMVIG